MPLSLQDIPVKFWLAEILLGVLALFLFLANLDSSYLWQDEAQRALIAMTILLERLSSGHYQRVSATSACPIKTGLVPCE